MALRGILSWNESTAASWMPIYPTAIGHVICQRAISVSKQDFFALHLVVKGTILFRTRSKEEQVLPEGSVFITDDRNACRYRGKTADTEIFWIRLSGSMIYEYICSMGFSYETSCLIRSPKQSIRRLMSQCFDYVEANTDSWSHSIVGLLYRLGGAIRNEEVVKQISQTHLAKHVKILMSDELSFHRTIKDFCYAYDISRSTLYKAFKEDFNQSPSEVLAELRHLKSLELLEHSHASLEEIALQAGYSGYLQFIRNFKRNQGIPPSDYKKQFTHKS